jgi:hypothetical protein
MRMVVDQEFRSIVVRPERGQLTGAEACVSVFFPVTRNGSNAGP